MRLPLLAALLCAAVGSSAGVTMSRSWMLADGVTTKVRMTEVADGVDLLTYGSSRFEYVRLTKEEAASLGRALLEAAGDKGLPCPCRPSNIYDDYVYCPKEPVK